MNPPAKTKPGPSSSMSGDTNKNVSVSAMEKIAREAGKLLMEKFHQHVKVEYKHEADLVTDADRKSEALILKRIRARWPKHNVIGEEGSRVAVGSDYCWLVDPLDGTTNFAHGFPMFCISLALERNSKRVAGVIYNPTRDELFAAEKGGGAYLNNKKIQVSSISQVGECLVATGLPSYKRQESLNVFFSHQMTLRTHAVRNTGSAALDLAYVACGRLDAFWESNLKPWDTAAGVLIVEEAGGRVSNFRGRPFKVRGRETLASNGLVHEGLLSEFDARLKGRACKEVANLLKHQNARDRRNNLQWQGPAIRGHGSAPQDPKFPRITKKAFGKPTTDEWPCE